MAEDNIPDPPRRKVYESTLFPQRKRRRRLSRWVAIPGLLIILGALLYAALALPHRRHLVETAGKILYVSDERSPGIPHLWIANADGSSARPLTSGPSADIAPTFSADGSQIAFLSNRSSALNQIYVINADGTGLTQVTRTSAAKTDPRFAPGSNNLLAFISGGVLAVTHVTEGDATLLLPARSGGARPQGTDTSQPEQSPVTVTSYAWMPGKDAVSPGMAAVEENNGIQTLAVLPALDSAPRDTQTGQPGGAPLAAASAMSLGWSPDGAMLAAGLLSVQGLPEGRKLSGLFLFDHEGSLQRSLFPPLPDAVVGPQNPVYAPDGSAVVFEIWRQPDLASRQRLGLFVVPTDGSSPPRTIVRGNAEDAHFLSDSSQIIFLAHRPDGGRDLCRINRDGTGFARLTKGSGDVSSYEISPQAPAK